MGLSRTLVLLLIPLVVLLGWLWTLPESVFPDRESATVAAAFASLPASSSLLNGSSFASSTPETLMVAPAFNKSSYAFGRYRQPIEQPTLHELGFVQRLLQLKRWHYSGIAVHERYLVGLAVAQFHYASHMFVYLMDTQSNEVAQTMMTLPLGLAASIPESSVSTEQCTIWRAPWSTERTISKCYDAQSRAWKVEFESELSGSSSIRGHVTYSRGTDAQSLDDSMVLVYPIGPTRPAYVHKQGAAPSSGRIVWRRPNTKPVTLDFTDGLTNLDWTKSLARRATHWHWVSFATRAVPHAGPLTQKSLPDAGAAGGSVQHQRLGVQLSSGVYDDPSGISTESTIWLDGVAHALDAPIQVSRRADDGAWSVRTPSSQGATQHCAVDLVFEPIGDQHSGVEALVISVELAHMLGVYTGSLRVGNKYFSVERVPGVLEDHYAKW